MFEFLVSESFWLAVIVLSILVLCLMSLAVGASPYTGPVPGQPVQYPAVYPSTRPLKQRSPRLRSLLKRVRLRKEESAVQTIVCS